MIFIFWISFGILLYIYFGYPLFLLALSKIRKNPHKIDENFFPPVSFIIPAHNEEEVIEAKLKNSLAIDYPNEIEIILAIDASTDRTFEIASQFPQINIKDFKSRRGKMAILNEVVQQTKNDIVVFTDANALFAKDVFKKLIPHLADSRVGCVGGVKSITTNGKVGKHEGIYWKFENFLKEKESIINSCFVDGSIYALKKEFYPLPKDNNIIMDDFAISLGVINKSQRVVFEPNAVAYEGVSLNSGGEFKRKIRILQGAITAIRVFSIRPVLFQIISHKIARWSTFVFMVTLLVSNLVIFFNVSIVGNLYYPLYQLALLLQLLFYGIAIFGWGFELFKWKLPSIIYFPFYFCLTSLAQIIGFLKYIGGKNRYPFWEKIER